MLRLNHIPWLVLLATAGSCLLPETASSQQIPWRHSYAAARKEAVSKGLPIIIEFTTANCSWCVRLEQDTLNNETVSRTINSEFIPLKINAQLDPQLAEALQIQRYPTVVLADADGRILGTMEGYQEAKRFHENLQRALARVANPEWMLRDYQAANKALAAPDYAKAVSLLKHILEDGRSRSIQRKSKQLLDQIEDQAAQQYGRARQLNVDGNTTEAMTVLTKLVRKYPGTRSASEAGRMLTRLSATPGAVKKERTLTAKELLGEAKEFYRKESFSCCLDMCQQLIDRFGDLPEAEKAREMQTAIQSNTAWMQKTCDELNQKLSQRLLLLAEAYLKKGERQKAVATYERIRENFGNSRFARAADYHLRQLRGEPAVPVDFESNK